MTKNEKKNKIENENENKENNVDYLDEQKLGETLTQLEKKAFKQAEVLLYFLHLHKTNNEKLI